MVRCNQATTPCLDKNLQYQLLCEIVQNRSLQEDACKDSMYAVYTVNVWAHNWLKISILIQGSLSPCANLQSVSLHSPRAKARHIASENWHRQVLHLDFNWGAFHNALCFCFPLKFVMACSISFCDPQMPDPLFRMLRMLCPKKTHRTLEQCWTLCLYTIYTYI